MSTWSQVLSSIVSGNDLSAADTSWVMSQVLDGEASPVSVGAFLAALKTKGETVTEVEGLVTSMLEHAFRIEVSGRCVDVVGTGGDGAHTVNISSMASIVVAAAGVTVVKHGNRAASSKSGSADVLGELGINLELSPDRVAALADEVGITFCFAQVFHPAMRFAGPIRKELGIPTVFNILGPLTNPAQPAASAIGVASQALAPVVAGVIASQGREALVFRSDDGLDELAATASATVWEVRSGDVETVRLDPVADLGLAAIDVSELEGSDAAFNAQVARDVFAGKAGAVRETVALNAAAGLVADATLAGTATGSLAQRMLAGLEIAREVLDSGAASRLVEDWATASHA